MEQIKPTELRIGNLIYYKGEVIRVTMVGEYGIQSKDDDRTINASFATPDLRPIPLTDEVLEKQAGFVWSGGDHYERGDLWLEDYKGGYRIVRPHFCHTVFTTLHHFQNLYFALTGSELEVSLPVIGNSPIRDNK